MMTGIGIKNLPYPAAKISLQDHDVMIPDRHHSRARGHSGELEPVGGEPQRTDGLAEYVDGGPASTEGPERTAGWVGNDLSLIPNMSIEMLDRQLARLPPFPDSPSPLQNRGPKAHGPRDISAPGLPCGLEADGDSQGQSTLQPWASPVLGRASAVTMQASRIAAVTADFNIGDAFRLLQVKDEPFERFLAYFRYWRGSLRGVASGNSQIWNQYVSRSAPNDDFNPSIHST